MDGHFHLNVLWFAQNDKIDFPFLSFSHFPFRVAVVEINYLRSIPLRARFAAVCCSALTLVNQLSRDGVKGFD